MDFSDALARLGAAIGLDGLALDENGSVSLLFDDEHEVAFTHDARDGAVILHAEVAGLSSLDEEGRRTLLRASLLGAETGGCALSAHEAADAVILWKRHDENAFQDENDLRKAVNAFLAQTMAWKARLASSGGADAASEAAVRDAARFGGFV